MSRTPTHRGLDPRDDVSKAARIVRKARTAVAATQAQFAALAGVPKGAVANLEGGYVLGAREGSRWPVLLEQARRILRAEPMVREALREGFVRARLEKKGRKP